MATPLSAKRHSEQIRTISGHVKTGRA